jgi:IclR family acetate operon transcriptional repressor
MARSTPPGDTATVGYQTRSLTRALEILEAFATEQRALTLKDLHELLALPKPTISRLARELAKAGYLRVVGRAYELGPKTFELGSIFARQHHFEDLGQAHLETLAAKTMQTASLALLAGTDVIHVLVAPSPQPVQHVTEIGSHAAAHATGLGKALLSALSDQELAEVLGNDRLPRFTPNTICDRKALAEELRRTRQRGFALDNEETAIGLKCVAVFVSLPEVGPAAVSVSGAAADYRTDTIPGLAESVLQTATVLEDTLGNGGQYFLRAAGLRARSDAGRRRSF